MHLKRKSSSIEVGMETNLEVRTFDSELSPEKFESIARIPIYLILDNLRSAFNVGSIIRTADCVLAQEILFTGYTAHPPHQKLDKTSLGALPYTPWSYQKSSTEAIRILKDRNVPVIAMELTNKSELIWNFDFPLPVGIVMGNEALGVSKEVLHQVDDIVEIPMLGFKNSINVAVAFGIVAYEIQRQHWHSIAGKHQNRIGEVMNRVEII